MEFNMETEEFSKIMRNIELSSRYKSIVRNPKLYLFYGPTGTGKSRLMKKLSQELKRPFIEISGSDIYNKYTGMSEKNAELVFQELAAFEPCCLLIDECDGLLSKRGESSGSDGTSTRVKSSFLTRFEELQNSALDVIVLCSTNRPGTIDEGFLSRFGKGKFHIALPDSMKKFKYLSASFKDKGVNVDQKDIKRAIDVFSENLSLRELETIVNESILNGPLTRIELATHFLYNPMSDTYLPCECTLQNCCGVKLSHLAISPEKVVIPEVRMSDIEKAASSMTPSNTEDIINHNLQFAECESRGFGESNIVGAQQSEQKLLGRTRTNGCCACCILLFVLFVISVFVVFVEYFM